MTTPPERKLYASAWPMLSRVNIINTCFIHTPIPVLGTSGVPFDGNHENTAKDCTLKHGEILLLVQDLQRIKYTPCPGTMCQDCDTSQSVSISWPPKISCRVSRCLCGRTIRPSLPWNFGRWWQRCRRTGTCRGIGSLSRYRCGSSRNPCGRSWWSWRKPCSLCSKVLRGHRRR